jgi:hypothetical protein
MLRVPSRTTLGPRRPGEISGGSVTCTATETGLKRLPHNSEAERTILGAILLESAYLTVAVQIVTVDDFFLPQHRHIFRCMLDLREQQQAVECWTVVESLICAGSLEAAGGAAYISGLADGRPRVTNVEHYARIVKEKAMLRDLAYRALDIQDEALSPGVEPRDLGPKIEALSEILAPERKQHLELSVADMPEDVLDGLLGQICQKRLAGLPLAYAWPALLCCAGSLVPQSPFRTNLYGCIVGEVGTGKSVACSRAIEVLGITRPRLETTLAGSAEGLLEKLSDANGDARLLSPDELGHLLTKARIDLASFPYVLNTAFYQNEFDLTVARGKRIHVNVALSVLGGIVEENFELCFGSATTGGLHDRFIFGLCPRPFSYLYRPLEGGAELTEPCAVTVAPEVWEVKDEWVRTIPGLGARCAEHAVRVAIIGASFSGRTTIYAKHLGPARAFATYQANARKILKPNPGENPDARCAFAILAAIDEGGPVWHSKRDISRKIHANRFGPNIFERAISALEATGEIRVKKRGSVQLRRIGSGDR